MAQQIYLMKYKVNYTPQTKYKAFSSFEKATEFHESYNHHVLNNERAMKLIGKIAFITHYDIIVLEIDTFKQTLNKEEAK